MKDSIGTGLHVVQSAATARALHSPRLLALLACFFAQPRCLSDAALHCGLPLSSCMRMAERLLKHQLLVPDGERRRAGRSVKFYRAAAPVVFVPYDFEGDLLPDEIVARLIHQRAAIEARLLVAAGRNAMARRGIARWGTLIYADRHGEVVVRPDVESGRTPALLDAGMPAYCNLGSHSLRLTAADAKQLQQRLVDLFLEYKEKTGSRRYAMSLVLAPKL